MERLEWVSENIVRYYPYAEDSLIWFFSPAIKQRDATPAWNALYKYFLEFLYLTHTPTFSIFLNSSLPRGIEIVAKCRFADEFDGDVGLEERELRSFRLTSAFKRPPHKIEKKRYALR
jgi:hypothetical protein